ncbi:MAG: hypothetical protein JWO33_2129 [Caulobacteraceae bacterium]|nr:hypothetical protein [Caulobacteraceae bacterium]
MKSWKLVIVAVSALTALVVGLPWRASDVGVSLAQAAPMRAVGPAS